MPVSEQPYTVETLGLPRADLVPNPIAPDRPRSPPIAGDAPNSAPVFAGTTRQPTTDGLWSDTSPAPLSHGIVDVSVPPDRRAAEVTLPGRDPDPRRDFLTQRVARLPFVETVYADGDCAAASCSWAQDKTHDALEIVKRPAGAKGFVIIRRCSVTMGLPYDSLSRTRPRSTRAG